MVCFLDVLLIIKPDFMFSSLIAFVPLAFKLHCGACPFNESLVDPPIDALSNVSSPCFSLLPQTFHSATY